MNTKLIYKPYCIIKTNNSINNCLPVKITCLLENIEFLALTELSCTHPALLSVTE